MKKLTKLERKKKFTSMMALLLAALLVLSMAAPLFAIFAAEPIADVTIEADTVSSQLETFGEELFLFDMEVGFDTDFIVQQPIPISGTITSVSSNFQGRLLTKSYINYANGTYIENYIDLDLKKEIATPFSTLAMWDQSADFIEIEIVNTNGKCIYRNYVSATPHSPYAKTIGLLSDDVNALSYLDSLSPTSTTLLRTDSTLPLTMVVPLTATTFTENPEMLNRLSSLIIDNFDLTQMTPEFLMQMESWVADGGVLLLGTGCTALPMLADLQQTDPLTATFEKFSETPFVVTSYVHSDLEILMGLTRAVLFSAIDFGLGNVILCHSSLSEFPLKDNAFTNVAIENYLIQRSHDNFVVSETTDATPDHRIMEMATTHLPYETATDSLFLIFFLGGYIILVVPVLYIVLKKLDKREFALALLPVCSIFFLGIHSFVANADVDSHIDGYALIGEYIALQEDSDHANVEFLLSISPNQQTQTANVRAEYPLAPFLTPLYAQTTFYDATVYGMNTGISKTEVEYTKTKNDLLYQLQGNYTVETGGSMVLDIEMSETKLTGTVTNETNLDFHRAYLMIAQDVLMELNAIKSGETIAISQFRQGKELDEKSAFDFSSLTSAIRKSGNSGMLKKTDAYYQLIELGLVETILENYPSQKALPIDFFGFTTTSALKDTVELDGKPVDTSAISLYHQVGNVTMDTAPYFEIDLPVDWHKTMKYSTGAVLLDAYDTTAFAHVTEDGMYTLYYTFPEITAEIITMQLQEIPTEIQEMYDLQSGHTFDLYNRYDEMWESVTLNSEIAFDVTPFVNHADHTIALRGLLPKGEVGIPTFTVRGGTNYARN